MRGHAEWSAAATKQPNQTDARVSSCVGSVRRTQNSPGLSPWSEGLYPWPLGPRVTWEGLSKGGRTSVPSPLLGPFTLSTVGTGQTETEHIHEEHEGLHEVDDVETVPHRLRNLFHRDRKKTPERFFYPTKRDSVKQIYLPIIKTESYWKMSQA